MKYIIYLHRNKINGKCYVGQTNQSLNNRFGKNGIKYATQPYFYEDIKKYGWNNFEHISLEEVASKEEADKKEVYWGLYYHALYPEGYCLKLGNKENKINTKEFSKIRSAASKENWKNKEYREKISEIRKKEWENFSQKNKDKCLSNLDRTGKGGLAQSKKVLCVETNIIYASTREAERKTNICHNNISQVCNGKRQTAGGYHWKFV